MVATLTPPEIAGDTDSGPKNGQIYALMGQIMREIEPIRKDRQASMGQGGRYNYRGIDDIYNHVGPVLARHGVFIRQIILDQQFQERETSKGAALMYAILRMRFYFTAPDGSAISTEASGVGMDSGDKAANKAMSVALREACVKMFCIPCAGDVDPEQDHYDPLPTQRNRGGSNGGNGHHAGTPTPPADDRPALPPVTELPPPEDLGDGLLGATCRVRCVTDGKPCKNNSTKWGIQIENGKWLNTFDGKMVATAEAAAKSGRPVRITFTDGQYGYTLKSIAYEGDPPSTGGDDPQVPDKQTGGAGAPLTDIRTEIKDVTARVVQVKGRNVTVYDVVTPLGTYPCAIKDESGRIDHSANEKLAAEISQRKGKTITLLLRDLPNNKLGVVRWDEEPWVA